MEGRALSRPKLNRLLSGFQFQVFARFFQFPHPRGTICDPEKFLVMGPRDCLFAGPVCGSASIQQIIKTARIELDCALVSGQRLSRPVLLEEKVAYQDKLVADLNEVVVGLHRRVDELRSRLDGAERTMRQELEGREMPNEKPPHY